jgi:hypothetical protein
MFTHLDELPTRADVDDDERRGYCKRCGCNVRAVPYHTGERYQAFGGWGEHVDEVCAIHLEKLGAPVEEEHTEDL